jgi:hypothetical protein
VGDKRRIGNGDEEFPHAFTLMSNQWLACAEIHGITVGQLNDAAARSVAHEYPTPPQVVNRVSR